MLTVFQIYFFVPLVSENILLFEEKTESRHSLGTINFALLKIQWSTKGSPKLILNFKISHEMLFSTDDQQKKRFANLDIDLTIFVDKKLCFPLFFISPKLYCL